MKQGVLAIVTIPESEYDKLKERDRQLTYLENWGVDNWEGYGLAMTEFNKEKEECE